MTRAILLKEYFEKRTATIYDESSVAERFSLLLLDTPEMLVEP